MVDPFQAPGQQPGTPLSSMAPPPPPPPAGWYPDGNGGHRYWDGVRWVAQQPVVSGPAPAPWGRRIPAYLIDMALLVPGMVLWFVAWLHEFNRVIDQTSANGTAPVPRVWVFFLGWLANVVVLVVNRGVAQGLTGKSLGKWLMKVRVVRIEDGANPGLGWGLLRALLESVVGIIDVVLAFVTDRQQRTGDMAAKTMVVDDQVAAELTASRRT